MKTGSNKIDLLKDRVIGQKIVKLLCCLIEEPNKPEDYQFENIQGANFGFDFVIDSGETISIQVVQIENTFGLCYGFDPILKTLNDGPKLWDITSSDLAKRVINKPIRQIIINKSDNISRYNEFKSGIEHIYSIEIIFSNDSFLILAAEYLPDKDSFYTEADEATIIVGKEAIGKYYR